MNDLFQETRQMEDRQKELRSLTMKEIQSHLSERMQDVLEGNIEGYKLLFDLKQLTESCESIKEMIMPTLLREVSEPLFWNGLKFEQTASGRYDYSECAEWNQLTQKLKDIEKRMQVAYKTGKTIIDEETGEIWTPANYKPSKSSIKITKSNL